MLESLLVVHRRYIMRTPLNAVVLVLLFGYACALSAAQGESSFTSFEFQLEDLDLNDGVTPSLSSRSAGAYARAYWDRGPGFDLIDVEEVHPDNSSINLGFASAHSSMRDAASFGFGGMGQQLSISGTWREEFELSAHTKVTFSAVVHAQVSNMSGFNSTNVFADILLQGFFCYPCESGISVIDEAGSRDGTAVVSLVNTGSSARSGLLLTNAAVNFNNFTPPPNVPEPWTYILMLLGIGMMAWTLQGR
jgi:hypothetical protein